MQEPGDPTAEIRAGLRQLLWKIGDHARSSAKASGLSVRQLGALRAIRDQTEPTPASVANEVHLTRSTMTGLLDALESQGWVERTRSQTDRRKVVLVLTTAGAARAASLPSELPDAVHQAVAALSSEERAALSRTLAVLVAEIPVPTG